VSFSAIYQVQSCARVVNELLWWSRARLLLCDLFRCPHQQLLPGPLLIVLSLLSTCIKINMSQLDRFLDGEMLICIALDCLADVGAGHCCTGAGADADAETSVHVCLSQTLWLALMTKMKGSSNLSHLLRGKAHQGKQTVLVFCIPSKRTRL
jgi:hypothetical protein